MTSLSQSLVILAFVHAGVAAVEVPKTEFILTSASVDQGQGTKGARPAPVTYAWNQDPDQNTSAESIRNLSPAELAHVRKLTNYPKTYLGNPVLNDQSSGIIPFEAGLDPSVLFTDPLCTPVTVASRPVSPQHGYWGKARRDANGNVVYKSPGTPFIEYDFTHNGWVEDFHAGLIDIAQSRKDTAEVVLIGDSITYYWDSSQVLKAGNMRPETAQRNLRYGYYTEMGPAYCSDTFAWNPRMTSTSTMPVPNYLYKPKNSSGIYYNNTTVNLGIPGDRIEHVLWRLDHGALDNLAPKVVVLAIGTNNCDQIKQSGIAPERVAEGIQMCVDNIRSRCPNTGIVVVKLLPRDVTGGIYFKTAKSINDAMDSKPFVTDKTTYSMVKVLDLWNDAGFTLDGGTRVNPALYQDYTSTTSYLSCLHPNDDGYIRYARGLRPLVDSLIVNNQGVVNGTKAIEVQISTVNTTQDVYVPFQVSGSAIQGVDYEILSKSPLVVPKGATKARITVAIKNTRIAHADRQVSFTLGAPQNAAGATLGTVSLGANTTCTLTITGNPPEIPNAAPTAVDLTVAAYNDTFTAITLQATDSDGVVTEYVCTPPANGSVVVSGAQVTYTPQTGFVGTDAFTYTATDDLGAVSAEKTVTITVSVRPPNNAPVAPTALVNSIQSAVVGLNFGYQIPAFTDPDVAIGGIVTAYRIDGTLPEGLVLDQNTRTISGVPTAAGFAVMTVTATDDAGATTSASFTIAVSELSNTAVVYDDAAKTGWKQASLGATMNAANTTTDTFRGTKSISVLVTYTVAGNAYAGFNAVTASNTATTFPLTGYDAVTLWANGGTIGGQKIRLQAKLSNGTLVTYALPTLKIGWMPITVKLSDLFGATPIQAISNIQIGNVDCTNKVFYIDDIKFGKLPVIGGAG